MAGLKVQMDATFASVLKFQPNRASVQLLNQDRWVRVLRSAAWMMIARATKNAALMAAAMSVLIQSIKVTP